MVETVGFSTITSEIIVRFYLRFVHASCLSPIDIMSSYIKLEVYFHLGTIPSHISFVQIC